MGVCAGKNVARVNDSSVDFSLSCISFIVCQLAGWFSQYLSFCLLILNCGAVLGLEAASETLTLWRIIALMSAELISAFEM